MLILGAPGIHSPTWTLLSDGEPLCSIEVDRLHRVKNRFGLTDANGDVNVLAGLDYILDAAGIELIDIPYIAFGFNPSAVYSDTNFDIRQEERRQERIFFEQTLVAAHLRRAGWKGRFSYVRHHLAHAAAAYFTSPFDEAAILTVDGWGEDETISVCHAQGTSIKTIETIIFPESVGEIYNQITLRLGWSEDDDGKTMGLSSYGKPISTGNRLISVTEIAGGRLSLDTSRATRFIEALPLRRPGEKLLEAHIQGAATVQSELTSVMLELAEWAHKKTGSPNLCLGGGVALNCVTNFHVQRLSPFGEIHMQPAPGDSGIPLGAALATHFSNNPRSERYVITAPYFGRSYQRNEYIGALGGIPVKEYADSVEFCRSVAALLADGAIVGWFQGKSEFGPRALGNRSILADPRNSINRDRLNSVVKRREAFRPFGPTVLWESASDFLELEVESPFMLQACPVRPHVRDQIPAVVHVDGTTRPQTLRREVNPLYYDLISAFRDLTGIPILVNTSFNIAGDPIVETPEDSVRCFRGSGLDVLALGQFLAVKG